MATYEVEYKITYNTGEIYQNTSFCSKNPLTNKAFWDSMVQDKIWIDEMPEKIVSIDVISSKKIISSKGSNTLNMHF